MTDSGNSSGGEPAAVMTLNDKMIHFRSLSLRRNEARKLNHQEVVEEDRKGNLPANHETRKRKAEYLVQEAQLKDDVISRGDDFELAKLRDVSAEMADKLHAAKQKKKSMDPGFAGFEAATLKQYSRLVKQIQPDKDQYERDREELGEELFYPGADTLLAGRRGKDSKEAIDRLVTDVERNIEKRSKFNRRRGIDPEAPVDYINERNRRFNSKIERFYGSYTQDLKQDLERGTAV